MYLRLFVKTCIETKHHSMVKMMFTRRFFSHSHKASVKPLIVYTDGSFMQNLLIGGMGLYFPNNEMSSLSIKYVNPIEPTSQRCELLAVKYALVIHHTWFSNKELHIYTDSKYAVDSLNLYSSVWQKNGWLKQCGLPVKNQDLLKPMVSYLSTCAIKPQLNYIPAHSKTLDRHSVNNNIADAYARRGLIMSDKVLPACFVDALEL